MADNTNQCRTFALEDSILTVAETATHLRVSRGYLYKMIEAGKIKPVKIGKRTLFKGREIQRFMRTLAA